MLKAVTRQASLADAKIAKINASPEQQRKGTKISTAYFFDHYATKEDVAVMVMEEDFYGAQKELIPSVSMGELEHYQKVRAQFEKVDDKATNGSKDSPLQITDGKGKGKAVDGALPERPRSKGKSKDKMVDRKGKGKAVQGWNEVDEDEGYNGYSSKPKGKAVDMAFQEQDDDDGLY